ncbi:branched-chain amino acid transport system II carrier protein [Desertibacillus haloalkaliphilus]|uniref:branched-chain amino acid transport system II carrier protein n=1 Tax=Desertibacillus haloalkaliphilus TaxID=1328930 RepID=UPI001C25B8C5|nr:branched-chain amino acid transport system II carrier protein [Desertibacillus haloalkaliphilus]MBU8905200.1 branched-chain amino acid transport system II carrier protein [Desertibacillus haloalkaliphilus]
MKTNMSNKEVLAIGLMMFALFLGAGNMIFPPAMGQESGTNVWMATLGFLITGVGLPVLAVIAIARTGGNLQSLANRINPLFGVIFTLTMYLAIGPFFGIPRTATVAFEIGGIPFLPESLNPNGLPLFIYSIVFFGITFWLALNPSKLVGRIGKVLTPILLLLITILTIRGIASPMGSFTEPGEAYQTASLATGFLEGYLTMDTIAALVFGIVVISRIKEQGITDQKMIASTTIKAGVIAGIGLSLVYLSLAYLGASSVETIGSLDNGGAILSGVATALFGTIGTIILALVITFACLTTSVGLVSACGEYFVKIMPKIPYAVTVGILCLFSLTMANMGLSQLISVSLPVLVAIYPIAIVLIVLSFLHKSFNGYSQVYTGGVIGAAIVSITDGLKATELNIEAIISIYNFIPLYAEGIGWLVPAILGSIIGYFIGRGNKNDPSAEISASKAS